MSEHGQNIADHAKRWAPHGVVAILLVIVGYFLWTWFSSDLSTHRVGPRPDEGRTVLVLLHGYGASGDDLVGFAEELSEALPDATFLVPEGPHRVAVTGRAWVPDFRAPSRADYAAQLAVEIESTSKLVWRIIDDARGRGARCSDIYVGGFSQGGRMAAEVALRAPQDCDLGGVIVLSGGGFGEVELPDATGRAAMRVLVTHGTKDGVVGIGKGKATAEHFAEGGHDVRWLQFDGPHTIAFDVRKAIPLFLQGEDVGSVLNEGR